MLRIVTAFGLGAEGDFNFLTAVCITSTNRY